MFGVETAIGGRTAEVCLGLSPVLVVKELPERIAPGVVGPVWSLLQVGLTERGRGTEVTPGTALGFWVWC